MRKRKACGPCEGLTADAVLGADEVGLAARGVAIFISCAPVCLCCMDNR